MTYCWSATARRSCIGRSYSSYGNLDTVHDMLTHDATIVGLGDGGAHVGVLCDSSAISYMLTHWTAMYARREATAALGDQTVDTRFRSGNRAWRSWCRRARL